MNDNDNKIEEQAAEIAALTRQVNELANTVQELLKKFKDHKHEGEKADGSLLLQRSIDLIAGQTVGAGGVAGFTGITDVQTLNGAVISDRTLATFATGRDTNPVDGLNNSQVYLEHQYSTDSTTKQTFFYGIRSPLYISAKGARISSGGTELTQRIFKFKPNELAGAYVTVNRPDNSSFSGFQIASNTETTLTITGGTWNFEGNDIGFTVFMPIYNGSASYPWRRLYTGDGSGGGIRFGYGATAGGQNGLLYSEGENLYWRTPGGSVREIDFN